MTRKFLFGAAIALLSVATCSSNFKSAATSPSFDEVLTSRRSIRNYDASKKITEAEVRELLTAAQEAPSWANQQPTKYYVAISPEKLAAVQDLVGGNKSRIINARCSSYPPLSEANPAFSRVGKRMRLATAGEHTTMALATAILS